MAGDDNRPPERPPARRRLAAQFAPSPEALEGAERAAKALAAAQSAGWARSEARRERDEELARELARARFERDVAVLDEHARRQTQKPKRRGSGRRYVSQEIKQTVFFDIVRLLDERETMTNIERATGTDRKLVAKIRDAKSGKRWQLERGQTLGTVVLVKLHETA